MSDPMAILLAAKAAMELLAAIVRALEAGPDVTDEQLAAARARADASLARMDALVPKPE
ncbi:MAG TPA: hypothetical protein VM238_18440 [Phycisphaerae bacterium]|nr:hypothetical protein [Phycisphaerae bacterium]